MIVVTARVKVRTDRRREFLQTVQALIPSIRQEKGCTCCHWYADIEDENVFRLMEAWKTRPDLDKHLKSDPVRVLTGAIHLLCEPSTLEITTLAETPGRSVVKTALG